MIFSRHILATLAVLAAPACSVRLGEEELVVVGKPEENEKTDKLSDAASDDDEDGDKRLARLTDEESDDKKDSDSDDSADTDADEDEEGRAGKGKGRRGKGRKGKKPPGPKGKGPPADPDAEPPPAPEAKNEPAPPQEGEEDGLPGPVIGGVSHCDKCRFDAENPAKSKTAGCVYPNALEFSQRWKPNKTVAFNVSNKVGCNAQANAGKRFDNGNYSMSDDWKDCIKAALAPSYNRDFEAVNNGFRVVEWNRVQFAGKNELERIAEKCNDQAKALSKGQENLFWIGFPDWNMDDMYEKIDAQKDEIKNMGLSIVGPPPHMKALKEKIPELDSKILELDIAASGAMGADVQLIALIATGRVKALWFGESYKKDCQRCEISSVIQVCKGFKKKKGVKINCMFGSNALKSGVR